MINFLFLTPSNSLHWSTYIRILQHPQGELIAFLRDSRVLCVDVVKRNLTLTTFGAKKVKYSLPPVWISYLFIYKFSIIFEVENEIFCHENDKYDKLLLRIFPWITVLTTIRDCEFSVRVKASQHLENRKNPLWEISEIGFARKEDTPPKTTIWRFPSAASWRWAKLWLVAHKTMKILLSITTLISRASAVIPLCILLLSYLELPTQLTEEIVRKLRTF